MLRRTFLFAVPGAVGGVATGRGLAQAVQTAGILDYGARPGGHALCTEAIQRAVDAVAHAGGGIVSVPPGRFLTGRIELKSRITLRLEAGATLLGSTAIDDYQGGRHLLTAHDAHDVTVTGPGIIDGQGPAFWEASGRAPLPPDQQWADVASHALAAKKSGLPSPMLDFVNCRRLRIDSVQLRNSPGWTLRALHCDDVEIQGIGIYNPVDGPNTDGIDLVGCQNVHISGCTISTGDDAICLKTQSVNGAPPRPVRNVTVTNCTLTTCCNGFKIGTESAGGFENITFSYSRIVNQNVPWQDRVISGVALEVVDGGWIDGVVVAGIVMERARTPIFIRLEQRRPADDPRHGLRNVRMENIDASGGLLASSISGLPGQNVQNIALSHLNLQSVMPCRPEWVGRSVAEKESAYPEARMFGMLPASGLYVRHVRQLVLDDGSFSAPSGEMRPTILLDDVVGAQITGLRSTPVRGGQPTVRLIASADVRVTPPTAPPKA